MADIRLTGNVTKVLAALIRAGIDGAYGQEIAGDAGVSKTTIYDILARIEQAGWATSEWERIDPREEKRPRRRIYHLTAVGNEIACRTIESELRALMGTPARTPWVSKPRGQRL